MSISTAREVRGHELVDVLGPLRAQQISVDALQALDEHYAEHPPPPTMASVRFWVEDGVLDVYLRDDLEEGIGHGGSLVATYTVPLGAFGRCLVCGEPNAEEPRPWCSVRCRMLLRDLAREQHPDLDDGAAVDETGRWAAAERHSSLGWFIPLTREIAEALYGR